MVRCLCVDCGHNDNGFCDETGGSPTVDYVMTEIGFIPMCTDYKEMEEKE